MSITIDAKKRVHLRFRYTDKLGIVHQKHYCKPEWKIKRDAKEFQDAFMLSVGVGHQKITVNDLYEHYIKEHKMKLNSKYAYDSVYRLYIKNDIGRFKVSEVNQKLLKGWQKELLAYGFSNNYLGKIQTLLRTVFTFGVRYEFIDRNPFLIENVKVEEAKHVIEHWIPAEFSQFIQAADDQDFAEFFETLYWQGYRYGECVALRANDYDWINGTLRIDETWDAKHKIATSPKTRNSYRLSVCTQRIRAIVERRIKYMRTLYDYSDDCFLFGYHTPYSPSTMQHAFERYIKKAGVKKINIHALRHSHVFMLRESGFDAFDIAKRMGHTVDMVNNTYGQFFLDRQKTMIEKMDEIQENVARMGHDEIRH